MRKAQQKHLQHKIEGIRLQLDRSGNAKNWQKVTREQVPEDQIVKSEEGERQVTEYDLTKTCIGLPAPDGWHVVERRQDGIAWERLMGEPLFVIESIGIADDGREWLHVSVSKRKNRMPTYDDLLLLRRLFIGEDRECYMIFPTKDRYVNIHTACLHLFCCLDSPEGVLPKFEKEYQGIKHI